MYDTQDDYDAPTMGHNKPPSDAEILQARLDAYSDEADELKRLSARALPEAVESDEQASDLALYLKAIKALESRYDAAHKKEKAPYLELGRKVDGWKTDIIAKLSGLSKKAAPLLQAWSDNKDEEERQRQFQAAKKAAEDAERLRAESDAHKAEGIVDTATELLEAAHDSEAKAETITMNVMAAPSGSLGKIRGGGVTASQKAVWKGEIENILALDLEKLRPYFTEDSLTKALNAAVRDGLRDVNGARIFQEKKLTIR